MVGDHVDSVTLGKEDMPYFDMAISALMEQPRWISVEERLPDDTLKGFPVVVCIQNRWNDRRCEVVYWWGSERMWRWQDVTHWMPLPEPPEVKV